MLGLPLRPILMVGAAGLAIYVWGHSGTGIQDVANATDSQRCEFTVSADVLNVRSGPGTQHPVVGKLKLYALTGAQPTTENGFRRLADDKWAAADFLKADDRNTCK